MRIIKKRTKEEESEGYKIEKLLAKQKGIIKDKKTIRPFKEPVLFLTRRDGKTEIAEGVTQGDFVFEHSDKGERFIKLDSSAQLTMEYGREAPFRYYFCHEDYPLPLNQAIQPLLLTDQVTQIIEKTMHDLEKLRNKQITKYGDLFWKFALGIVIIIGTIALAYVMAPGLFDRFGPQAVQQIGTITPLVQQAATNITQGGI